MMKIQFRNRRVVVGLLLVSAVAGGVVAACGDDDSNNGGGGGTVTQDGGIVFQDGGVVTTDGGVVYQDGGVAYIDGGFVPYDAGPSSCSDASTNAEPLGAGIYGCGGSVAYADRDDLCAANCRVCSPGELRARIAPQSKPTRNYWINDSLERTGEGAATCIANSFAGDSVIGCGQSPTFQPMHVCVDTSTDPEGNSCNWSKCGLTDPLVNEHFGGCSGNITAGSVCCRVDGADAGTTGCASGTDDQTFTNGMSGCKGTVAWTARDSLCAPGYTTCTATQWVANRGGTAPTHNYWTKDNLRYSGSNANCTVSTSVGTDCTSSPTSTAPMHVCGAGTAPDPDGNRCATAGCSLEVSGSLPFIGGCLADGGLTANDDVDAGYARAGTLCCCGD